MCEKIGEHFNIFVFYIKISCQSKESLLSKRSHLQSNLSLSRKNIFPPHPFCQIRGTQSIPYAKEWGFGLWSLILGISQRDLSRSLQISLDPINIILRVECSVNSRFFFLVFLSIVLNSSFTHLMGPAPYPVTATVLELINFTTLPEFSFDFRVFFIPRNIIFSAPPWLHSKFFNPPGSNIPKYLHPCPTSIFFITVYLHFLI